MRRRYVYFKAEEQFKESRGKGRYHHAGGQNGISDHLVQSLSDALDKRELIKISVLENAEADAKAFSVRLAEALSAEVVAVIGRKIILYRRSEKENARHIAF